VAFNKISGQWHFLYNLMDQRGSW